MDLFSWRTRLAPATIAAAPALALAIPILAVLPGLQKLWALVTVGMATLAGLLARRAGHEAEGTLFDAWGGAPTTIRLRYRAAISVQEVQRRHQQVLRILGPECHLPTLEDELADGAAADAAYIAAVARIRSRARGRKDASLLHTESANYGFARNLFGLRRVARFIAWATLTISLLVLFIGVLLDRAALWASFPVAVAVLALVLWRAIDESFVRPSANAYADRLVDLLDELPTADENRQESG